MEKLENRGHSLHVGSTAGSDPGCLLQLLLGQQKQQETQQLQQKHFLKCLGKMDLRELSDSWERRPQQASLGIGEAGVRQ